MNGPQCGDQVFDMACELPAGHDGNHQSISQHHVWTSTTPAMARAALAAWHQEADQPHHAAARSRADGEHTHDRGGYIPGGPGQVQVQPGEEFVRPDGRVYRLEADGSWAYVRTVAVDRPATDGTEETAAAWARRHFELPDGIDHAAEHYPDDPQRAEQHRAAIDRLRGSLAKQIERGRP